MDEHSQDFPRKYLRELSRSLRRSGFETLDIEDRYLPVRWEGRPLCRISDEGSVFYRREDRDKSGGEDALLCVEDIAAQTLAYMTAMETAPQLKASGLEGDCRILADFGGAVLAGHPAPEGTQFITWAWDCGRTGVSHGHYFLEDYAAAKLDFAIRSGLVPREVFFQKEQLTEICRCVRFACELEDAPSPEQDVLRQSITEQIRRILPQPPQQTMEQTL